MFECYWRKRASFYGLGRARACALLSVRPQQLRAFRERRSALAQRCPIDDEVVSEIIVMSCCIALLA
eukprot:1407385-Lingulodinium_polyedra.AAC.1